MTHHMLPKFGRDWARKCRNAFLIRAPEDVLISYAKVRGIATLDEIGIPQQAALFDLACDWLGRAPPVIDGSDVLADPRGSLSNLCKALDIPFTDKMLAWSAGRRATDGVWAPAWYAAVEASTGFGSAKPPARFDQLTDELKRVADAARPIYEKLRKRRLSAVTPNHS